MCGMYDEKMENRNTQNTHQHIYDNFLLINAYVHAPKDQLIITKIYEYDYDNHLI